MQENQYEKIRVLFFKLIEETKELSDTEFENIVNQVFKENESFTSEMKERLVIDIAKMRSKILN
jgi:DNA anti-recombination protein RmuC